MSITEIIARLGHACGLPWARCSSTPVLTRFWPCIKARGHGGLHYDGEYERSPTTSPIAPLPSTLAEWAAEWERDNPGEPGPVAEWRSPDGRTRWSVLRASDTHDVFVTVRVAEMTASKWIVDSDWAIDADTTATPADIIELGRLAGAADGRST